MSHTADELIIGYLADDLTQDQVTKLEQLLRYDPSARDRFAVLSRDDVVLRQVVAMMAKSGTGRHTRRTAKSSTRLRAAQKNNKRNGIQFIPMVAAAMVAAVIAIFIGLILTKESPTTQKNDIVDIPKPTPQDVVKGDLQVVMGSVTTIDGRISIGGKIPAGRTLIAADGEATLRWLVDDSQLTLAQGSKLKIQTDAVPLRLVEGALTAHITRQKDRPFTLVGPHATTSVMGTKFRITATAEKTSIQVIEGRVSFHASVCRTMTELIAGEQASADHTGLHRAQTSGIRAFVPERVGNSQPIGPRWWHRATIRLHELQAQNINIRVDCTPDILSVRCKAPDSKAQIEREFPFYVLGNNLKTGNIMPIKGNEWVPAIGTFIFTARPCFDTDSLQPAGPEIVFELTVVP